MSWFAEEKSNFPKLASRDLLPNLWLKYERSDRVPLRKSDCMATFAALTSEMKKMHADKVLWKTLEVLHSIHSASGCFLFFLFNQRYDFYGYSMCFDIECFD
jgi:hypothetical protein